MNTNRKSFLKSLLGVACLAFAFSQPALAVDVNGIKMEDTAKLGGKDLVLNGAGMRVKAIFKVYATGLYLTEKKSSVPDIMAMTGPRRVRLVLARDISSDDFGEAFMTGLNDNSDKNEKTKIINQTMQFGEMFALLPGLKKGDVLHLDWVPGTGTVCELNGKRMAEPLPDVAFFNAVLRIWLGEKPVDRSLKPKLLGEAKS